MCALQPQACSNHCMLCTAGRFDPLQRTAGSFDPLHRCRFMPHPGIYIAPQHGWCNKPGWCDKVACSCGHAWMVRQYPAAAAYIAESAKLSKDVTWRLILQLHLVRSKEDGGPLIDRKYGKLEPINLWPRVRPNGAKFRGCMIIGDSFELGDGENCAASEDDCPSEDDAYQSVCRTVFTELVLRDVSRRLPNATKLRLCPDHWKDSPPDLLTLARKLLRAQASLEPCTAASILCVGNSGKAHPQYEEPTSQTESRQGGGAACGAGDKGTGLHTTASKYDDDLSGRGHQANRPKSVPTEVKWPTCKSRACYWWFEPGDQWTMKGWYHDDQWGWRLASEDGYYHVKRAGYMWWEPEDVERLPPPWQGGKRARKSMRWKRHRKQEREPLQQPSSTRCERIEDEVREGEGIDSPFPWQ